MAWIASRPWTLGYIAFIVTLELLLMLYLEWS